MWKVIVFDQEARNKVFAGLKKMTDCVKTTMWSFGYNVILDNMYTVPEIVNDGVTVVKAIDFEDRYENIAAYMLKKACNATNMDAWDGTTTCAVLSCGITQEWLKYINDGVNPFKISKYMNMITGKIIEYIKENSIAIKWDEDIKKIATISSQDEDLGHVIMEAYKSVGEGWVVSVEESKDNGITIENKNGIEFDQPLKNMNFITDVQRMQCELENAYVFVSERKLSSLKVLASIFKEIQESNKNEIIFIVEDIDISALALLIQAHRKWSLKTCVVKAPSYGPEKEEFYKDICTITGATLISEKTGLNFKDLSIGHLGIADKVVSWRARTLVMGSDKEKVEEKEETIKWLQADIKRTKDDFKLMKKKKRLARLTGWISTILVWYPSDVETNNKRMKIEDAVNAVRAAIEEGVIYGSWVSLIEAIESIELESEVNEERIAYSILKKALQLPLKTIIDNSGESGEYVAELVKNNIKEGKKGHGYDIENKKFVDLIEIGIIDPAKVIRVALENAVSLANMILTSKSVVTEDPNQKIDDQDVSIQ